MSMPTAILEPPMGPARDSATGTDFQQVVGRAVAVLSQRCWLFVLPLLGGALLALAVSLWLPRRYVLNTLFERRDDVVITNLVTNNSPYSFELLRRSLPIELAGYNALSQAVDDLGLAGDLPRTPAGELTPEGRARKQVLIARLGKQTDVNLMEKSTYLDLIEVRYTGDDPEVGAKLAMRLKENYIARTQQRIREIFRKSHEFFSTEANQRKERVATMEAELLQLAVQHPGVDPADPGVLDQRLLNHNLALEELTRKQGELESKLSACREYLGQLEGSGSAATTRPAGLAAGLTSNPRRQQIAHEIEKVRGEIADAKALKKMTDLHPAVVGLRDKLEQLRAQWDQEPSAIPAAEQAASTGDGPGLSALEAERRRVRAEMKSLGELLAQTQHDTERHQKEQAHLEEEKGGLFERRQAFLVQQQELSSAKTDLRVWEGHVDTIARVLAAEAEARGIQFATVEEARRPAKPVSPTVPGVLLVSLAAGLALGTAAVFLREIFDRSFRNAQGVRRSLGLPILEMIPDLRVGPRPGWRSRRRWAPVLAGVQAVLLVAMTALVYLSLEKPAVYRQLMRNQELETGN